jgi:AcrR family transcriptional regulator
MADVSAPTHTRGPKVADRILRETLGLLAEDGYGFSVDAVATRAGVHKTTIYRRWKSKPALVAAAMQAVADTEIVVPDDVDPVAGLEALAVAVASSLRAPASLAALRALVSAAGEDPDLLPVARAFFAGRYRVATTLIEAAQLAGMVRDDVDPTLVWEAMVNPLHLRAITGAPADGGTARSLVRLVLSGCVTPAGGNGRQDGAAS